MEHSLIVEGRLFQMSPPHNGQHVPPIRGAPVGNVTVTSDTGPGAHTSQSLFPYKFIQWRWSETIETLIYEAGKSKSFKIMEAEKVIFFKNLADME